MSGSKIFEDNSTCDKRLFKFNKLLGYYQDNKYPRLRHNGSIDPIYNNSICWAEGYAENNLLNDLEEYITLYPNDHDKISDTIIYTYNSDDIDNYDYSSELLNIFAIYIDINILFEYCILYKGYPSFVIKEFIRNHSDKLNKNIPWFSYLTDACYDYIVLIDLVEYFLKFGFKLNTLDYCGQNELHQTCYFYTWSHQYDIMEYLVNKGVDINHKCRDDCTPLDCFEYCISNYGYDKNFEKIRKLLK